MQYGRFAVMALGSQKTGHFDLPTEGCCFQPAGSFTQGQYSDIQFHQALDTTFNLRGAMLQASFTDWHSGWRVAQAFALNQLTGESDAVQPLLPVLIDLGSSHFSRRGFSRCSIRRHHRLGLLFLHHRGRSGHGSLHLDDEMAQHGVVELE